MILCFFYSIYFNVSIVDSLTHAIYLCVTHAGSHEISVINHQGMHSRLASLPYPGGFSDTAADVPNDLGFLSGLRTTARQK